MVLTQARRLDFLSRLRSYSSEIRVAFGEHNYQDVAKIAHQVRGASGLYGYPELTRLAKDVEESARMGMPSLPGAIEKFEVALTGASLDQAKRDHSGLHA